METACRGKSRQSRARSSMDRATGFYPVGWGFESLRAHFCAISASLDPVIAISAGSPKIK